MKFPVLFLLLSALVTISSCSEAGKEKKMSEYEIKEEKEKNLDTVNQNEATKLTERLNAIAVWDTSYQLTYHLQETFESGIRPISFTGDIRDVVKKDSVYILKLSNDSYGYKNAIAEVSISSLAFQELKKQMQPGNSDRGCFIFRVNKITSHYPILASDIGDERSYLTYDFDDLVTKFEGELIDYYIYKKLKDE